jgi:hypothetical protein
MELKRRVGVDQDTRRAFIALMQEKSSGSIALARSSNAPELRLMLHVDADNRAWLKGLVNKIGWPGKSLVGEDGAHDAWLLVQHCDADKLFQRTCLKLMEAVAAAGEVSKMDLAYLTDRVLVGENKKQLYGTQTRQSGNDYVPDPIEDASHVDERRASVGMPPLAEYMKQLRELYTGQKSAPAGDAKKP